jgi:hypothetical protein
MWLKPWVKNSKHAEVRAKSFGVPVEAIQELERASRGRCMACGREQSERRHAIDHCHATNVLRGVLCRGCNTALGHMHDNPENLRKLADYIEKNAGGFIFSSGKTVSCKIKLTNPDSADASATEAVA